MTAAKQREAGGLGPKPEQKWQKLSQLSVPTEYQRSVKSNADVPGPPSDLVMLMARPLSREYNEAMPS